MTCWAGSKSGGRSLCTIIGGSAAALIRVYVSGHEQRCRGDGVKHLPSIVAHDLRGLEAVADVGALQPQLAQHLQGRYPVRYQAASQRESSSSVTRCDQVGSQLRTAGLQLNFTLRKQSRVMPPPRTPGVVNTCQPRATSLRNARSRHLLFVLSGLSELILLSSARP